MNRLPSNALQTLAFSPLPLHGLVLVRIPSVNATEYPSTCRPGNNNTLNVFLGLLYLVLPFHHSYSQSLIITMVCSMGHTFSPTCMLHHASNEFTRRASVASTDPPPISVQYFYCSILPIHDPLLPIPSVSSNPATSTTKVPPRPFSVHDNIALEDGWLKYQKRVRSKNNAPGAKLSGPNASPMTHEHILRVVKESQEKQIREAKQTNSRGFEALEPMPENKSDMISKAIGNPPHTVRRSSPDLTLCDEPRYIPFDDTMPVTSEEIGNDEFESGIVKKKRSWSPFRHREKAEKPNERDDIVQSAPPSQVTQNAGDVNLSSSLPGRDTSGTPFLRIPSRLRRSRSRSPESLPSAPALGQADGPQSPQDYQPKTSSPLRPTVLHESSSSLSGEDEVAGPTLGTSSRRRSLRPKSPMVKVPKETTVAVGMLRLHVVRMPSMKVGTKCSVWNPAKCLLGFYRCGPYTGIRSTISRRLFVGPGSSGIQ